MAMPVEKKSKAQAKPAAAGQASEQELLAFARQVAAEGADWIELHNAVFGIGGKFGQMFVTAPERSRFFKSPESKEINQIIEHLQGDGDTLEEIMANVNGKLLLRVPRSIHAALLAEADAEGISLNQLCLSKLCLQLRSTVKAG